MFRTAALLAAILLAAAAHTAAATPRGSGTLDGHVSFYTLVPVAAPEYAFDLAAVSDTSVWYTTSRGVYHFDGRASERVLDASLFAGAMVEVFLVEALSDDDVWVLGHDAQSWIKTMYHYDGRAWSQAPFPPSDEDRSDERVVFRFRVARDAGGTYGVAVGDGGLYYTFDGKRWVRRPPFTGSRLRTVEVLGRDDIRAAGKGGEVFRFDGSAWRREPLEGSGPGETVLEMSFSSPRAGWAVTGNGVYRWAQGKWSREAIPAGISPRTVKAAGDSDAWIFTDNGTALRWDGSAWRVAGRAPMQAGYASVGMTAPPAAGGPQAGPAAAGDAGYTLTVVTTAGIMANAWGRIPTFVDASPSVNIHLDGGEVVVADFDGNGTDDLFVAADGTFPDRLYSNRGDAFYTETTDRLHPPGRSISSRPAVADLDNNGFPDIIAHRGISDNLWYPNRGSWSFVEAPGPLPGSGASNYSRVAPADVDADGDLDIVRMPASEERRDESLVVWMNDGVGRFGDSAVLRSALPPGASPMNFLVSDLDGDGLPDLFKYNVGAPPELWLNGGGTRFRECAAERGLGRADPGPFPYVTWARAIDIDRNGSQDLFIVLKDGLALFFLNGGGGVFARGDSIRFDARGENPAGGFSDIDCDGDQDLFLLDRFYENRGGRFAEYRFPGFRKIGSPAFTDIDGDGDEDVVFKTLKENRGLYVLQNGIDAGNALTLDVRGTRSNSFAVGAAVTLWRRSGGSTAGHGDTAAAGWVLDQSVEIDRPGPVRLALDTAAGWRLEVRYPSGIVVRKEDLRPGRMTVAEFGTIEGAWWDFCYSFRRTLLLADPAVEGLKLAVVVIGVALALMLGKKRFILPPRANAAVGFLVVAGYVLAVHGTIRQGAAASWIYPIGGAAAATTAWVAVRGGVERRRRERRISHYLLGEPLGEGGMGKVFAATDTVTGETVAVKVLGRGLLADPENRRRLMAEGHLLSSIAHPNIVKVFEVGEHLGQGFIAMEYLPGGTLETLCRSRAPLPFSEAKGIALGICEGLREIHGRGVIHRDLKSGNVMFGADGAVRIMDFGLSKSPLVTTMTTLGTILGTLGYVSPEQVTNISVDRRADLFSFGVLLYEMLTGKLPFNGENEMAVIHAIFNVEPPPPSSLNPAVPSRLDAVVRRCLRKNPDERYGSAEELGFDLLGDYW